MQEKILKFKRLVVLKHSDRDNVRKESKECKTTENKKSEEGLVRQ